MPKPQNLSPNPKPETLKSGASNLYFKWANHQDHLPQEALYLKLVKNHAQVRHPITIVVGAGLSFVSVTS